MSKLQASADGQTIQFLALPKIFSSLGNDLPSGKIELKNGEFAYWRLHRNLTDLKRKQKNMMETVTRLTNAFKTIVRSKDFLNHYGLSATPDLPEDRELQQLFRNLLSQNTNRVSYTSTYFGGQRPRVESIQVMLGNMVFFNAHKGMENPPKAEGMTGRMWLDKKNPESFYRFSLVSPVVALGGLISADRLAQEITTKIKQNLPDLAKTVRFEFDPGQFNNYMDNGLEQLTQKHNSHPTNKDKKHPKGEQKRGQTPHIQHMDDAPMQPEPAEIKESITLTVEPDEGAVEVEGTRGMPIEEFRSKHKAADHAEGTYALVYNLNQGVVVMLTSRSGEWEETVVGGQEEAIAEAAAESAEDQSAVAHHKV